MALSKALTFIKQFSTDLEFRKGCNKMTSKAEFIDQMGFNEAEFEDAIRMNLLKCQTYEEAEEFEQIKFWFTIL